MLLKKNKNIQNELFKKELFILDEKYVSKLELISQFTDLDELNNYMKNKILTSEKLSKTIEELKQNNKNNKNNINQSFKKIVGDLKKLQGIYASNILNLFDYKSKLEKYLKKSSILQEYSTIPKYQVEWSSYDNTIEERFGLQENIKEVKDVTENFNLQLFKCICSIFDIDIEELKELKQNPLQEDDNTTNKSNNEIIVTKNSFSIFGFEYNGSKKDIIYKKSLSFNIDSKFFLFLPLIADILSGIINNNNFILLKFYKNERKLLEYLKKNISITKVNSSDKKSKNNDKSTKNKYGGYKKKNDKTKKNTSKSTSKNTSKSTSKNTSKSTSKSTSKNSKNGKSGKNNRNNKTFSLDKKMDIFTKIICGERKGIKQSFQKEYIDAIFDIKSFQIFNNIPSNEFTKHANNFLALINNNIDLFNNDSMSYSSFLSKYNAKFIKKKSSTDYKKLFDIMFNNKYIKAGDIKSIFTLSVNSYKINNKPNNKLNNTFNNNFKQKEIQRIKQKNIENKKQKPDKNNKQKSDKNKKQKSDKNKKQKSDKNNKQKSDKNKKQKPDKAKNGEQKNGEQKNGEQNNGEQNNGEQKNGEQNNGEQNNGEQNNGEQKNSEQENGEQKGGSSRFARSKGKRREQVKKRVSKTQQISNKSKVLLSKYSKIYINPFEFIGNNNVKLDSIKYEVSNKNLLFLLSLFTKNETNILQKYKDEISNNYKKIITDIINLNLNIYYQKYLYTTEFIKQLETVNMYNTNNNSNNTNNSNNSSNSNNSNNSSNSKRGNKLTKEQLRNLALTYKKAQNNINTIQKRENELSKVVTSDINEQINIQKSINKYKFEKNKLEKLKKKALELINSVK